MRSSSPRARLDSIDLQPPDYLARLQKVKEIFDQNHLEMIPNIFSAGYGGGILAHDKNLAEGLPEFAETEIRYLNEPAERLAEPDDPVIAANVRRLNDLLFAPLDYALVARTAVDA